MNCALYKAFLILIDDILKRLQALHERLDNLERIRLPAMDSRIQHAMDAPLSQVLLSTNLTIFTRQTCI